ncbi:conserved hypothetical protein [Vibrio phage 501E54-1]|nr:conserved hypothetical protein [Vibrio phage 501E54-1]
MAWELEAREFNSIERAGQLAEALGEVVPDLLGQFTITDFAYTVGGSGSVQTYSMSFRTHDKTVEETINFNFTSVGTETHVELLTALVAEGNTTFGDKLFWAVNTDYDQEADMYFTVATKEGVRLLEAPTMVNVTNTQHQVQAPVGKPAAHTAYMNGTSVPYPKIVVTPLPITSVSENFTNSTVNTGTADDPVWTPYFESYIKVNFKITVEAGGYTEIQQNGITAEDILRRIKMRLREDKASKDFLEKIDATVNRDWTITPTPMLHGVDWRSVASTTLTLDVIERFLEPEGGIMTTVEISEDSALGFQGTPLYDIPTYGTVVRDFEIETLHFTIRNFTNYLNYVLALDLH